MIPNSFAVSSMGEEIFPYVQGQKLRKMPSKVSYLIIPLPSDHQSQSTLQVFCNDSKFPLECSSKRAYFELGLDSHDDNHEKTGNHGVLSHIIKKKPTKLSESDSKLRNIFSCDTLTLTSALFTMRNLQELDLSSNLLGDKGIEFLSGLGNKALASLEQLNIADNRFGHEGARRLGLNTTWSHLKVLNISGNLIGNNGMKYIAENSAWSTLQKLLLNHIGLDSDSAKSLAANESWKKLQELCLNENPKLGNQGLMVLTYNKSWSGLQKLSICDCEIKSSALISLRRNKYWKNFQTFTLPNIQDDRKSKIVTNKAWMGDKPMDANLINYISLIDEVATRGGGGQGEKADEPDQSSELLFKLNQLKEKVKDNKLLDEELKLFIETRARDNLQEDLDEKNIETFALEFKIKKFFLDTDNAAKVLLITGEVGSGKSLFCKFLQRSIITDWNSEGKEESDETVWLPIYVDLSQLENPKISAASEVLSRELLLAESEIKFLKDSKLSKAYPRLLFIFDNYEIIQDTRVLKGHHHYVKNNFYSSNAFGREWPNAKIIITCREDSLADISQRELLFSPLNEKKGIAIPGSYLEYTIKPFSDIEITAYLRKYVIDRFPTANQEDDINESHGPDSVRAGELSSWRLVKNYEEVMDCYKARELLRTPLLLHIAIDVLRDISECGYDRISYLKEIQVMTSLVSEENRFDRWFFHEAYINRSLASTTAKNSTKSTQAEKAEQETQHVVLLQRLQFHALSVSKYTVNSQQTQIKKELTANLDEILVCCSLLRRVGLDSSYKFIHRSVQEFLIAQAIISEITENSSPSLSELVLTAILNQRLLEPKSQVMSYLAGACSSTRIKSNLLLKIVKLSKEIKPSNKGSKTPMEEDKEEPKEQRAKEGKSRNLKSKEEEEALGGEQIKIASSNSMTILNLAKFDFKDADLVNVTIPGAYLCDGRFEKADFSFANLVGVNFTGAWLKETNFSQANMTDTEFGIFPDLKFSRPISCCEFSPDGQRLAVAVSRSVVIFERDSDKLIFKEVHRMLGHETEATSLFFSSDGKKLISAGRDKNVCVWDVLTGVCLQKLVGRKSTWKYSIFSPDNSQIGMSSSDQSLSLWDAATYEYNLQIKGASKDYLSCEFSPNGKQILYIDQSNRLLHLRDTSSGRLIKKYRFYDETSREWEYWRYIQNCYFVSSGRQIAARLNKQIAFYTDTVRNYQFKTFQSIKRDVIFDLEAEQTIFLVNNDIILQDTATGKFQPILQKSLQEATGERGKDYYYHAKRETTIEYCVSYDLKIIAELLDRNTRISFLDIPSVSQRRNK